MLQYASCKICKRNGLAVVDPHGEWQKRCYAYTPERVKDVVYFNPDDLAYPIGLNLLELTPA